LHAPKSFFVSIFPFRPSERWKLGQASFLGLGLWGDGGWRRETSGVGSGVQQHSPFNGRSAISQLGAVAAGDGFKGEGRAAFSCCFLLVLLVSRSNPKQQTHSRSSCTRTIIVFLLSSRHQATPQNVCKQFTTPKITTL
jgi:hypothetical protein